MEGRFKRSDNLVRDLSAQVANLQEVIATMSVPPSEPAPEPTSQPQARSVTPEELEEYGTEFLDVVGRQAKDAVNPEVASLKQQITSLQQQLQNVDGRYHVDARAKMHQTLDEAVQDWRTMNNDPNFIAWLQLPDAYSGAIRHQLLKDAYDKNEAARVVQFFKGFLAEEAATDPAIQPSSEPGPDNDQQPGSGLKEFAAPGRAKPAAGATPPAEKPIITRAQITKFYADVRAGKYRGREKAQQQAEQAIFAAQGDGRIR